MRNGTGLLVLSLLLIPSPIAGAGGERSLIIDDFEHGMKSGWRIEEFQGRTRYTVVNDGAGKVLKAESSNTASGLIYELKVNLREYPLLTWRWKVERTLKTGDATRKEGDDYAARVYVIFPHWFPVMTKSINYIWANRLPKGQHLPNPYYAKAIMVAVQSGDEHIGAWIEERRNVYEDFKRLFGDEPPEVGAIAIMTDTDQTGESVTAYYDDIRMERLEEPLSRNGR